MLRTSAGRRGWVLCTGAGISIPAFPSWADLALSLLSKDLAASELTRTEVLLDTELSPSATIQAAENILNQSSQKFVSTLSEAMYAEWFRQIPRPSAERLLELLLENPSNRPLKDWEKFIRVIETHFPGISALSLARLVYRLHGSDLAPRAILSFNAEPLFYALLNAISATEQGAKAGKPPEASFGALKFDLVLRAIDNREPGRIPYFCCHGLLPIPSKASRWRASPEKLVFSETDYLALADRSFSWQASVFLENCSLHSLVFVGVSLTDPNMRRWLSSVHSNRRMELDLRGESGKPSAVHYWIRTKPQEPGAQRWLAASVAHLGIRIVWLDDWSELIPALNRMLEPG